MRVTNKYDTIPTGGRLTSGLFTRRRGVEFGATKGKSIQWQGGGFEPGTSGLQIQRPTTRPRSPLQYTKKSMKADSHSQLVNMQSQEKMQLIYFELFIS